MTYKWIVLTGAFTGDGSEHHRMFRLRHGGETIPTFKTEEKAKEYVRNNKNYLGEETLITAVILAADKEIIFKPITYVQS